MSADIVLDFPLPPWGGKASVQARTASGPSSNTGRKARRESPPPALSQKGAFAVPAVPAFQDVAHVDYLSFTAPISAQHQSLSDYTDLCIEGQCYFIAALEKLFGIDRRAWKVGKGGFNGYRTKMATPAGAVIAWGGVAQRGTVHISLPGTVCAGAPGEGVDWHKVARFGELNAAKITRLDLAHDDFTGEEWNIEKLDALYAAGEFTSAGRPPARSFTESDTGRTLYFGKRQNGKMLRGYEKGRQMGDSQYPKWFRVEGEVRCKDRVIPWDALNRPGEFLAGLYPALKVLSVLQDKIATTRRIAALTVDQLKKVLQTQYGQFLNLLSFVHQGDGNCVLFEVSRPGFPKKFAGLAEFLDLLPPAALAAS